MSRCFRFVFVTVLTSILGSTVAHAGEPSVLDVKVSSNGNGTYGFSVTIRHADTGWDHYADKFDVMTADGKTLGTRVLYHPHVNEQPFTRSIGRVEVPIGVNEVTIRAHDKVHKYGTRTMTVKLPPRR